MDRHTLARWAWRILLIDVAISAILYILVWKEVLP